MKDSFGENATPADNGQDNDKNNSENNDKTHNNQPLTIRPGILLVAAPTVDHAYFEKAVILINKHDPEIGTMGIMLNEVHPAVTAQDIEMESGQEDIFAGLRSDQKIIRLGGPEEEFGRLLALHDGFKNCTDKNTDQKDGQIGQTVFGCTGPRALPDYECDNVIIALGFASWEPGVLEDQIFREWNVIEADEALVFGCPPEKIWEAADAQIRGKGMLMTLPPGKSCTPH